MPAEEPQEPVTSHKTTGTPEAEKEKPHPAVDGEILGVEVPPIVDVVANIATAASPSVDDKPNQNIPEGEPILLNLILNVIVPTFVLMKLSGEDRLGPVWAVVVGLAFPIVYGIWDLIKRRRWNIFSIIGVASVTLTGGMELLGVTPLWFAVKEAAIPLVLGLAVVLSMRSKRPLVKTLLLNPSVLNLHKVYHALHKRGNVQAFERHLDVGSWWLAGSFLLSAVLNFVLTIIIIKSPAGTEERVAEIGKQQLLSYPVIVVPTTIILFYALYKLMSGIKDLTGYELEEVFHTKEEKKEAAAAKAEKSA